MIVTTTISGHKLMPKGVKALRDQIPGIGRVRLYRAIQGVVRDMKVYPAERPNQKYKRTYGFQKSWSIVSKPKGYAIKNSKTYGHFVVGDGLAEKQAWMHKGRWKLLRVVIENAMNFGKDVRDAVRIATKKIGFRVK